MERVSKICSNVKCSLKYAKQNIDQFKTLSGKGETSTCLTCRQIGKKADDKRINDPKRKETKKQADLIRYQTDEYKERRKEIQEKSPERYKGYWQRAGIARKEKKAKDPEFAEHINKQQRDRRFANPEQNDRHNETRRLKIQYRLDDYKRRAPGREKGWNISDEMGRNLLIGDCYYCGEKCNPEKQLHGIDRMDNNKGYINGNVCSSCEMCNMMKRTKNTEDFIKMCKHIVARHFEDYDYSFPEVFDNHQGSTFYDYTRRVSIKGLVFELSKEDFNNFIKLDCYLCGKKANHLHRNGIDRINNNQGYTCENMATCCGDCNFAKKNYELDDFLNRCFDIVIQHE